MKKALFAVACTLILTAWLYSLEFSTITVHIPWHW